MRIGGEVPGSGSILLGGSKATSEYGVPLPQIVNANPAMKLPAQACDPLVLLLSCSGGAPCGTSPVLTMRQSAISSLRARATIMILRAPGLH